MKLSDADVLNAIEQKARESYGYNSDTLNAEREQSLNYYLGRPFGNEIDGRSQVVTRDTLETVEWMLPALLKIFTSGDKVVEFQPKGAEDVEAAEQETSYVNHVVMQQNDSFMALYTWFKDALDENRVRKSLLGHAGRCHRRQLYEPVRRRTGHAGAGSGRRDCRCRADGTRY